MNIIIRVKNFDSIYATLRIRDAIEPPKNFFQLRTACATMRAYVRTIYCIEIFRHKNFYALKFFNAVHGMRRIALHVRKIFYAMRA